MIPIEISQHRMHGYLLICLMYEVITFRNASVITCVGKRISRLRRIQAEINQVPTIPMTKREVTTKKLESKIIMPVNVSLAFTKWLMTMHPYGLKIQLVTMAYVEGSLTIPKKRLRENFCCLLTYIHSLMAVRLEAMDLSFILTLRLHALMHNKKFC